MFCVGVLDCDGIIVTGVVVLWGVDFVMGGGDEICDVLYVVIMLI